MFNFSTPNIIAGILFGIIGFVAFSYGKKMELWKPMSIGLALMGYSWLVPNIWANWIVGILLCVLLWFHHGE
ncbi:hypothetical protein JIN85_03580 [Luteolibacter pohnpeiensis]|uniref:Amino acid transport protein n=1 Tax=Luteolibacter pohnpeiensis TaxID=454153 RepID=A0A934VPW7_9BACT|nr:hypothetical protein [Luteolibacter pohnpeiensis]MBK1881481.1 hypothetical protein [Luteolibacter pohnpeiensis]